MQKMHRNFLFKEDWSQMTIINEYQETL
jgi:hypothetical protein